MVFFVLEFGMFCIIVSVLTTQIIYPFLRGTSYFPIFSKERTILKKLEEVKQNSVELDLIQDIVQQRKINDEKLKSIEDFKKEETNDKK